MTIVSVYAVFADDEEAARIGRKMVEERFAACVNILDPCASIYRWEGQIETANEVPAVFKTGKETAAALVDRIAALHSYDTPCVVVWPVNRALPAYANWVCQSTGKET
ncbi:divalent-cation tolerance protein CutA [Sphingomonas sabuli]|uniref:Divalent-cation tolerance protein CutA n=1 Tax=Sphingomonas sabuli TaxID=2764186 RepID=A0A7G9L498_9SPHN|nr:divalent-cation tolerance protein CutA [Sphingomonas sabuli]QNM83447.1 divalent-cation tolerance protein CutA [Sphingomonas sabuli]